jgi:mannosyltransferase OCH1-like enzyme
VIPRTFHTFWDGPPIPEQFVEYRRLWAELHPRWLVLVWSDTSYQREVMSARTSRYYRDPARWSPRSNVWQWRADIARYEILEKFGGVWIDADLEPLRPIDPIVERCSAFAAREDQRNVNNAFMGCEIGHPFIVDVMAGLGDRIVRNRHLRVNRSIGAGYLTAVAQRHDDLLVLPSELVYPFSFTELHRRDESFPDAFTKHHWNNRTQARRRQLAPRRR